MKIRCLVVDDEPLAVKLLQKHIERIESLEVVATASSALQAFEVLNTSAIDLMFLDIKMPKITGLDFLKTLKNPPKTIFTTAYREFAMESYDLEVVDYLLKPITFERFLKAVDRFLRTRKNEKEENVGLTRTEREFRVFKSGNKYHKVYLEEVLYIESIKDYVKIHLLTDQRILVKYKIGDLEEELKTWNFLRIHRSYLVNTQRITAFTAQDIEIDTTEVPIGASYKEKVSVFLDTIK